MPTRKCPIEGDNQRKNESGLVPGVRWQHRGVRLWTGGCEGDFSFCERSQRTVSYSSNTYLIPGMNTSIHEISPVRALSLHFEDDAFVVALTDGRSISIPLTWYPRLFHSTIKERENYRFIGDGVGIHWPELDEDISVSGLIAGRPSRESQESLAAWLATRP